MVKRLLLIVALGVTISGCYMVPMALVGPMTSGWSTASVIQSGLGSGANYLLKQSTGKTIGQHAIDILTKDTLQHTYFPKDQTNFNVAPQ